jgi:YggT family protein
MFALRNLLDALTNLLGVIFTLAEVAIFLRVILSWANADPYNGLVKGVTALTEPILRPFRKIVPPWRVGGWDLSPLFAILAIDLLRRFLIPTLYELASKLR